MRRIAAIFSLLTCCMLSGGLPAADDKKTAPAAAEKPATPEGIAFFEKKIRPVLADKCFSCHSAKAEKLRGNLLLDTREGTRKGGDLGAAVVPGNVKESLLIQALHHKDEHLKMPPKQKLSDEVIADFETWVKMGAPFAHDGAAKVVKKKIDIEKGRRFWAFQPPMKAVPPPVQDAAWPRSDIDRFVLGALEARNLKPAGDADQRTLLRRVYHDLTGLPPSPEDVENFVKDQSPQALENVVDRLLASPQYGERWGRHWLDVARYAESCGKQFNFNYPHAWRYRNYVIAAFNSDKPYDRFVKEQLAGDLLPAADEKQKAEMQIATSFLAIGAKDLSERNALQFSMDVVDEQIDVSTQAFLGLTVGCARCHDHKFDPIPMKDYYALAGIFRSTTTCYGYGSFPILQNANPSSLIRLWPDSGQPVIGDTLPAGRRADLTKQLADAKKQRAELFKDRAANVNLVVRNNFQIANLESQLDRYQEDGKPKQQAMGVRERLTTFDSPTYVRGEIDKPGEVARRGYVQVLSNKPITIKSGSGRLELAEAIGGRDNPLTARVMANRVWLHLFGAGIVATPDNFGASGQLPSNQPLLDHLAVTFMDDGWSVKKLIRRIVLSHAYQLSSQHLAKNYEVDPDNTLIWRMAKKRQDAESLRDGILAVSGQLDLRPPKASSVALAGEGVNFGGRQQQNPFEARDAHRTVYMAVIRNQLPEALALFDFAETSMVIGERPTTTVPSQGLYLLNSQWVIRQAESAADKLLVKPKSDGERIREGYLRFFGRPPSEQERQAAEDFLVKYEKSLTKERAGASSKHRSSWSALCQAWFASAEFLYVN